MCSMQLTSSRPGPAPGPEDVVVPGQEDVPVLERELRTFFRWLRQWQRGADRIGLELDEHTFGVLSAVHDRGPSRLQDLAADLGLDASTVSRHVTGLERSGLLARVPDPDDGRARRVILTAAGSAAWSRDRAARRELVRRALSRWPAEDRRRLTALLTQLNEELATLLTEPEKEPA